jgi:hypothetical protein
MSTAAAFHAEVYISTDPAQDALDYPTHHRILTVQIPSVVNPALRDSERKVIAAEIRKLLKALGIKKVSVTAPNYSVAQCVGIDLPYLPHDDHPSIDWPSCPVCSMHRAAVYRLEVILLSAFPDLDDRSDVLSDYFDFRFLVR